MKNTTVLAFLILIGEVMARGGRGRGGRARRSMICAGMAPGIAFMVFGFLSIYKCKLQAGQAVSAQAKIFKHGFLVALIAFIIIVILTIVALTDDPGIIENFLAIFACFCSLIVMLFWAYGYYMTGTVGASFTPAGE